MVSYKKVDCKLADSLNIGGCEAPTPQVAMPLLAKHKYPTTFDVLFKSRAKVKPFVACPGSFSKRSLDNTQLTKGVDWKMKDI